jgi:hypothetical protein
MDLVQVDMVGLQTAEAGLHSVHDVTARSPDVIPPGADAAIDLGRDYDILPRDVEVFQRLPQNSFALTFRVIVRRIKEVDAAVNRRLDEFIGPGLANGADALEEPSAVPECHGSEAELRNQETCIAERCVLHDVFLFCEAEVSLAGRCRSLVWTLALRVGKNCGFGRKRLAAQAAPSTPRGIAKRRAPLQRRAPLSLY